MISLHWKSSVLAGVIGAFGSHIFCSMVFWVFSFGPTLAEVLWLVALRMALAPMLTGISAGIMASIVWPARSNSLSLIVAALGQVAGWVLFLEVGQRSNNVRFISQLGDIIFMSVLAIVVQSVILLILWVTLKIRLVTSEE